MMRAVIKLRSGISAKPDAKHTFSLLRLNQVNHCVLAPADAIYDGMLNKVKDYVTWGEVKPEVLARMILRRGRLVGGRPITNKYVKDNTKYDSLAKYAEAITNGKESYAALKDVKPLFRLHPPLQGHEGIKHTFKEGGALGYRGDSVNELIQKMLGPEKRKVEPKEPAKKPAARKAAPKKVPVKKAAPKKPVKKEGKA